MSDFPKATISTKEAAEAIYMLFQMFEPNQSDENLDAWRAELEENWPDLAAMLFTVSHDE